MGKVDVFSTSSSIIANVDQQLSTSSVNIANSDTKGYRRTDFHTLVIADAGDAIGARQLEDYTADQSGAIVSTANEFSMALSGPGWFTVKAQDDSIGMTRNGYCNIDANGFLVNEQGYNIMAWKIIEGQSYASETTLEPVQFFDVGVTAEASSNVLFDMNLNASEESVKGVAEEININYAPNVNNTTRDIILPDDNDMFVGDEFTLSNDSSFYDVTFGGIAASNNFENDILGTTNELSVLQGIKDGDKFIISNSIEESVFMFSSQGNDKYDNKFYNIAGLAEAINYDSKFTARIYDGKLYISGLDATDSLNFSMINYSGRDIGESSYNLIDDLGILSHPEESVTSLSPDLMFGGMDSSADKTTYFTESFGLVTGDSFNLRISNGAEYTFTVNKHETLGTVDANEDADIISGHKFNNLKELTAAINSVPELKADIIDDKLFVETDDNTLSIYAIIDSSSNSKEIVDGIGIGFNTSIGVNNSVSFDNLQGTNISFGSYNALSLGANIDTTASLNAMPFVQSHVITDEIFKNNFSDAIVAPGCYTPADLIEVKGADGIQIELSDSSTKVYKYKSTAPDASTGEFNSMMTLKALLQSDGLLLSDMGDSFIKIGDGTFTIDSISGINGHEAEILGLQFKKLSVDDDFRIELEDGQKASFNFALNANPENKEFNTLVDLYNLLDANIPESFVLNDSPGEEKGIHIKDNGYTAKIKYVLGSTVNNIFQGGEKDSTLISVKYNPNTNDYDAANTYNDMFSFKKSIEKLSNGALNVNLSKDALLMNITTNNGSAINYIDDVFKTNNSQYVDDNLESYDGFAKNAGLVGGDLVNALSLSNIGREEGRFSTLNGLHDVINKSDVASAELVDSKHLSIFAADVRTVFNKTNKEDNVGDNCVGFLGLTSTTNEAYQPEKTGFNVVSGAITPNFQTDFTVYDALGADHQLKIAYVKFENNQWGFEIFAANKDDISTNNDDGLLLYGELSFDGEGMYLGGTSTIPGDPLGYQPNQGQTAFPIEWTNGAAPSDITLYFKLFDDDNPLEYSSTAGLRQFSSSESYVRNLKVDGYPTGEMQNVKIEEDGVITAIFANSATRSVYKLGIATVSNQRGLMPQSNGIHYPTSESGDMKVTLLKDSKSTLNVGAYEDSNTDFTAESMKMLTQGHISQITTALISQAEEALRRVLRIIQP